jgi:hypothetical protein
MFGLFRKKDNIIENLLSCIRECEDNVTPELKYLASPMFKKLASAIKNDWDPGHVESYKKSVEKGHSHESFVYNFVVHSCGDNLESGNFHVYRGVLDLEGNAYLELLNHAINTMINKGEYTSEWAEENLKKPVKRGIEGAG